MGESGTGRDVRPSLSYTVLRVRGAVVSIAASDRAIAAVVALFAAVLLAWLWVFVFSVGEPFAFYKDLGVNYITLSYATRDIHTLRDFVDTLAWSPWFDQPLFNLNPYLSYVPALPLAFVFKSVWFDIKILEALELVISCAACAWLCRVLRFRPIWSVACGLCYAVLPVTALAIRGNLDMGWTAACAPAALAAGLLMLRRWSLAALPLVGVVCSLFGFCIGVEYLVFTSIPIYVALAISMYARERRGLWAAFTALGFVTLVATGSYFLFPSLLGALFSDSAVRANQLTTDQILPLFSETPNEFAGLVPRESVVSPVQIFNAIRSLWVGQIAGCALILFAIGFSVTSAARLRQNRAWIASAAVVFICLYLSFGTNVPLGPQLWRLLAAVPLLDAIRTPDRFMLFPALAIVILGVKAIQRLELGAGGRRYAAAAVTAILLTCFTSFDFAEHCFQNQYSIGSAEPDLFAANDAAAKLGSKNVALALVNGGSPQDYPSYGVPVDSVSAVTDWASRYVEDGIGGVGLMQRAGARSVVATPMWATADARDFPDFASIFRNSALTTPLYTGPQGVVVARIPHPRSVATLTKVVCLRSGPGLLDQLLALPAMSAVSLQASAGCGAKMNLLANFDPIDTAFKRFAVVRIPATALFGSSSLEDADYDYPGNRALLKDLWYRNSVDGDAPVFDRNGAILVTGVSSGSAPFTVDRAGKYVFLARVCAHERGSLEAYIDGFRLSAPLLPALGMRWLQLPVDSLARGPHTLSVRISTNARGVNPKERWDGIAVDGVALVSAADLRGAVASAMPDSSVAVTLDRRQRAAAPIMEVPLAPGPGGVSPMQRTNVRRESVGGASVYAATASLAELTYLWRGGTGEYVVDAAAHVSRPGDALTVALLRPDGSTQVQRTQISSDMSRVEVQIPARLQPGDRIRISMDSVAPGEDEPIELVKAVVSQSVGIELAPRRGSLLRGNLQFTGSGPVNVSVQGLNSVQSTARRSHRRSVPERFFPDPLLAPGSIRRSGAGPKRQRGGAS